MKRTNSVNSMFLSAIVASGLLAVATSDVAWARKGGDVRMRVEAKIETQDHEFSSRRNLRKKKKNEIRDRFRATLEVPADAISVADLDGANVDLALSRDGAVYATCDLEIDDDDLVSDDGQAQWKVDIRHKLKKGRDRVRVKRGSCDNLDPAIDDPAIPNVRAGDVATVTATIGALDIVENATYEPK